MPVISFIAKPVQVEAINWTGENLEEIRQFCNNMAFMENGSLYIETLEGTSRASVGDWIVRGTRGEFYPIKPDVMEAKYERKNKYRPYKERVLDMLKNEETEL